MIYYLQYHNSAHILATAVIYGITLNNANLVTSAKILFNCVKMSLKTVIYKYCFIIFGFLFMEKERLCMNGALEQLVLHGQIVRSPKPFHWWNIFVSQCQYFYFTRLTRTMKMQWNVAFYRDLCCYLCCYFCCRCC